MVKEGVGPMHQDPRSWPERSTRKSRVHGWVRTVPCALIVVLSVVSMLSGCSSGESATTTTTEPKEFSGYVQSPPRQVADVTLPAVGGTPVRMVAEPGGLRIVYFGYTFCPDVCPTTMSFLKTALGKLSEKDRNRVQVDMVTIDPTRDTGEKLHTYVSTFVPDATAIRTDDPTALRSAADAFGASYEVTTGADGELEVSHSGDLFVVDDTGTIILAWPFGTTPKAIEQDLIRLLDGQRPTV